MVLEFKLAKTSAMVKEMKRVGKKQIRECGYADSYGGEGRKAITVVLVADAKTREVR